VSTTTMAEAKPPTVRTVGRHKDGKGFDVVLPQPHSQLLDDGRKKLRTCANFHILTGGVVTHFSQIGRGARLAPRAGCLGRPTDIDLQACCGAGSSNPNIAAAKRRRMVSRAAGRISGINALYAPPLICTSLSLATCVDATAGVTGSAASKNTNIKKLCIR